MKDWNFVLKTPGKQLNIMLLLGVISVILYVVADYLQKIIAGPALDLMLIKGIAIFLAVYYFAYCLILTKKVVDKHYK